MSYPGLPPDFKRSIGSDLIIPNYITQDPITGAIGANFTGHVKAAGLDLSGGPVASLSQLNLVDWLLDTDATKVAEMFFYDSGGGLRTGRVGIAKPGSGPGVFPNLTTQLAMTSGSLVDGSDSQITVTAGDLGTHVQQTITLLTGNGQSSFLQAGTGSTQRYLLKWGESASIAAGSLGDVQPGLTNAAGAAIMPTVVFLTGHIQGAGGTDAYHVEMSSFAGVGSFRIHNRGTVASTFFWLAVGIG